MPRSWLVAVDDLPVTDGHDPIGSTGRLSVVGDVDDRGAGGVDVSKDREHLRGGVGAWPPRCRCVRGPSRYGRNRAGASRSLLDAVQLDDRRRRVRRIRRTILHRLHETRARSASPGSKVGSLLRRLSTCSHGGCTRTAERRHQAGTRRRGSPRRSSRSASDMGDLPGVAPRYSSINRRSAGTLETSGGSDRLLDRQGRVSRNETLGTTGESRPLERAVAGEDSNDLAPPLPRPRHQRDRSATNTERWYPNASPDLDSRNR